jgi:F0F1-type ATP synthase delta subunit
VFDFCERQKKSGRNAAMLYSRAWLSQDQMEKISAFMHERFGKQAIPTSQAIALPG